MNVLVDTMLAGRRRGVTAIIVTRGDTNLAPILDSLIFEQVVVWDNSLQPDLRCFGRYAAINLTDTPFVYFQDDDCLVSEEAQLALLKARRRGALVANMDTHWGYGHPLWLLPSGGLLCERDAPARAFARWLAAGYGPETLTGPTATCSPDLVFSVLSPGIRLDYGKTDLPRSGEADAIHQHPDFDASRRRLYDTAAAIRGEDAAAMALTAHVENLRKLRP